MAQGLLRPFFEDLNPSITNSSSLKRGLLVTYAPGKTVGKMVAEFVGMLQLKDETVHLFHRRIENPKLEKGRHFLCKGYDTQRVKIKIWWFIYDNKSNKTKLSFPVTGIRREGYQKNY